MKTCDKCGSTEFTKDGRCKPCRKLYMKSFRIKNADQIKVSKRKWNLLNADKVKIQNKERSLKWRQLNPEKSKLHAKAWAKANPEKAITAKKKWLESNRDKHKVTVSLWSKNNRVARRIHWQNYKSRKLAAGGSYTKEDITKLLKTQKEQCAVCRDDISSSYHIDHIMPLSLGGSNGKENIQLLCPHCNLVKGAKHPIEFMQSRGFLL